MMKIRQVLSTNEFQKFVKSSRRFCYVYETSKKEVVFPLQQALLDVYLNGLNLQTVKFESDRDFKKEYGDSKFEFSVERTSYPIDLFEINRLECEIDKNEPGIHPIHVDILLDDLKSVYKVLSYQLRLFDMNYESHTEYAIWRMRHDFVNNWSNYAIHAIRLGHYLLEKTEKFD